MEVILITFKVRYNDIIRLYLYENHTISSRSMPNLEIIKGYVGWTCNIQFNDESALLFKLKFSEHISFYNYA